MARGRMVSKTLSTSRKFAKLSSEFAQVLYVLIVAHADDFGRQSGDAFTVKHQVFPTSPRDEHEFEAALNELNRCGLVTRYTSGDEIILQVVSFEQHQVGLHKRSASRFPENPGTSGKFPEIPSELKGREQKGREENGTEGRVIGLIPTEKQLQKLREFNAFVGARLRIPHVLHNELRTKCGADGDTKLHRWYLQLDEQVEASGEAVPDIFAWLRPRFVAWCVSEGLVKPATVAIPAKTVQAQSSAVEQAMETRRRRAEMQAQGMSDDDIEAVFEQEYDQRKAAP